MDSSGGRTLQTIRSEGNPRTKYTNGGKDLLALWREGPRRRDMPQEGDGHPRRQTPKHAGGQDEQAGHLLDRDPDEWKHPAAGYGGNSVQGLLLRGREGQPVPDARRPGKTGHLLRLQLDPRAVARGSAWRRRREEAA